MALDKLKKPAYLHPQCFQKKDISEFSRTRVQKEMKLTPVSPVVFSPSKVVQYSVPHMCELHDSKPVSVALNVAP